MLRVLDMLADQPTALSRKVGRPFPADYAAISNTVTTPFSGELRDELAWECCILCRYADRINSFLGAKQHFERLLLTGDYDSASGVFEDITSTYGCSLWAIDAGVLVSEYGRGLAANREFVKSIGEELENKNVLGHAAFYSQRAERNVSTASYDREVRDLLGKALSVSGLVGLIAKFWFAVDFATFDRYDRLADVVYYGSPFPIVDRYATFVRVLQTVACHCDFAFTPSLVTIVKKASSLFCDSRIRLLVHHLEPETEVVQNDPADRLAEITHHYTVGEYHQASLAAEAALVVHPDCFEFYELFAKSQLHLGEGFRNPLPDGSVSQDLLLNVYNVLKKNQDTPKSLELLRKVCYSFDSARFASQVLAFICENGTGDNPIDYRLFGGINGIAASARFATCFRDPSDGLRFLTSLRSRYAANNAVELFSEILSRPKTGHRASALRNVPPARELKYRAAFWLQLRDYQGAITEYKRLRSEAGGKMPFHEDVVRGLFKAYLGAGMYEDAIRLIVDTYLMNRHLLLAIRLKDCLDVAAGRGATTEPTEICRPIFYSICYREGLLGNGLWDVYVQYDDFLTSHGVVKPSDLLLSLGDYDQDRVIYFLRHVCVPEVMDNSPFAFATTKELEDERIVLCQALQQLDHENADLYSREIHELMRRGMIRESIRNVDRSKIYIDTSGIAKSLDSLCREKFQRCLLFASLDERLRKTPALRQLLSEGSPARVIVWTDMGFEAFREVFDDIKRRYIFSNEYGLDSYISVRVRHGTLAGQIRSHFEAEHLITRLNAETGSYDENKYWKETTFVGLGGDVPQKANVLLMEFSREIDRVIDTVKNRWLQIKGEQNGFEGMFDFDYSCEQLLELWAKLFVKDEVASYDNFIAAIFSELNHRTTENLERVQRRVREDLRDRLTHALDTLLARTSELHCALHLSQFAASVTRCRTNIQNELETIAGWFENFEQAPLPDFEFEHLVDTTIEMVRKCYPSRAICPKLCVQSGLYCQGAVFTSFIDIMFIVLENVARHSTCDGTDTIVPTVAAQVENGKFRLDVSNDIPESADIPRLRRRLEDLSKKGGPGDSDSVIRAEGGSGYYKLLKIVRYDLRRAHYDVSFAISEDNRFIASIQMPIEGITV